MFCLMGLSNGVDTSMVSKSFERMCTKQRLEVVVGVGSRTPLI